MVTEKIYSMRKRLNRFQPERILVVCISGACINHDDIGLILGKSNLATQAFQLEKIHNRFSECFVTLDLKYARNRQFLL